MLGNSISTLSCQVGRTFRAAAADPRLALAGVTEPHRHDGDAGFVVEGDLVHPEPLAQSIAGGSSQGMPLAWTPGYRGACPMISRRARSLPRITGLGPERQVGLAQAAGPDLFKQDIEGRFMVPGW